MTTETSSETHYDTVSPTEVHALLGNRRRMLVIGYLSLFEPGKSITVRHLARVVRGIEIGTAPTQVDTGDYESAYNGLIQTHLPRLADNDLIEYDDRSKAVTVTPRLGQYALIISATQFVFQYLQIDNQAFR